MAKKKRRLHNIDKDTWTNTAKEQPYLMPGTDEYEEYQRDLKFNDPFCPDDEMHAELEESNVQKREDREDHINDIISPVTSRRKYINESQKRAQFGTVKADAIRRAKLTDTFVDDKKANNASIDQLDDIVYNDGVTSDDFVEDALPEYEP